jgi:hypothetical protein
MVETPLCFEKPLFLDKTTHQGLRGDHPWGRFLPQAISIILAMVRSGQPVLLRPVASFEPTAE